MTANSYYFFTDANPQASNASDYIHVQTLAQAYGPVSPPAVANADEYRVTSLHTASFNPTAYAACDAVACVQRIPSTALVNIILRPLVQPALNFAPVKYIIYKGVQESSLISGADVALASNNDLTQAIHDAQVKKNAGAGTNLTPSAEALGVGLTAAAGPDFTDTEPIDNLFYQTGVSFQLPVVRGGWSLGQFDKTGLGIEVLMDGLGFNHPLSLARKLENRISVPSLAGGETSAQVFDHWHVKEQVLGYMDPCAFYGSFFRAGVQAKSSGNTPFVNKSGNALYNDVLFAFANKNISYLDIRNEHGFSFNYFKNYGRQIQLSYNPANVQPSAANYYASGWPVLTLPASSFPVGNTTKARNVFQIRLPVGDNPQPLLYVSQGYRDINNKGKEFPAELKNAERFIDAFKTPVGGYTVTKSASGLSAMIFAVPNVTGQSATTPASCYIRLKYLKQQQGATAVPTVIQSSSYLDNLVYPLDLRTLHRGAESIKSSFYDEEVYVNAQQVPGLECDFIGKVGIARDADNTSFFVLPTNMRTSKGQASALVSLSGEASDYPGHYPNFVALKFPLERVKVSGLTLSGGTQVPVAAFVSDGDAAARSRFHVPDFDKFFVIVVANAAYDSWKANVASTLDGKFRVYLGVKNLQTQADGIGVKYVSFELVLRGFVIDPNMGEYKVQEMSTDPVNTSTNIKIYAYAGT